jgi:Kef-type K+ transport system membrane component KefB
MFTPLALLVLAGLLGIVLSAGKRPLAPVLVGELLAGVVIGNTGLHLIDARAQPFPVFMSLGFLMLMLVSGMKVDLASAQMLAGARRGTAALLVSAVLAIPAGFGINQLLGENHPQLFVVLLAGSSAAVAFPTFEERRLTGPTVSLLVAWITLADAVTAILMPLTLSGVGQVPQALLGDGLITLVATVAFFMGRWLARMPQALAAVEESKERHWALQLRLSLLLVLILAAIAEKTGASLLIAGFAAGIVLGQFHEPHRLRNQLAGVATGFFVPAFFVLLGASLDLRGLITTPTAIALAIALAAAAVAVHVLAALFAAGERRVATGLLASAQLGLPAAAAAIGIANGRLSPAVATALVAGGLLTLIPASVGAMMMPSSQVESTNVAENALERPAGRP